MSDQSSKDPKPDDPPFASAPQQLAPSRAEHWEFLDILTSLERGAITEERARARILSLYHLGAGAWIRSLGVTHPKLAAEISGLLISDLTRTSEQLELDLGPQPPRPVSPPIRMAQKTRVTLSRERVVLKAFEKGNHSVLTMAELLLLAQKHESDLTAAALTANLDRLVNEGHLERVRKGHYSHAKGSKDYLARLESEIVARQME